MPGKDATLLRKATSRLMPECRCRWHLERQLRLFGSGDQRMELSNPPSSNVVLLRHGQSIWNKIPTFSGWCDVPLTDRGIEQAIGAARVMKEKGFVFDFVYTSALSRAYRTAEVIMEEMNDNEIAVEKAWQLNERHYGALQGLAKNNPDLMQKYGKEQLTAWRREMTAAPPPMNEIHPHWAPPPAPLTESLLDTQERVIKYWHETIVPSLRPEGKNALVSAHANTIRSLIAYLDDLSHDEVPSIHVPNSVPCLYKIDPKTGKAIRQDFSPLSKSKGVWILSAENLERLVEKLGGNSEAFARSVFSAWDSNNDGVLTKEEIMSGLSSWQRDDNPAIKALSGKLMEELIHSNDSFEDISLEEFQNLAVMGSRRHNLPFFSDETLEMPIASSVGSITV